MAKPATGRKAPDFALPAADGTTFRLSEHAGRPVVLYFYPEDATAGCTIENQEFSALLPEFEARGAVVAGISEDSIAKHCKFRDNYRIATTLVSDPDHKAIGPYGVWGPKVTFGHHLVGLIRTTFLIGSDGRIVADWHVTRIKGHAAKVLEAVKALPAA